MENKKGRKERRELERGLDVCSCIPFWFSFIDVDASFLEKNLLSFRTCFLIWREFATKCGLLGSKSWKIELLKRILMLLILKTLCDSRIELYHITSRGHISLNIAPIYAILGSTDIYSKKAFQR